MSEIFSPPQAPSVGSSVRVQPRVWIAQFGDGYQQRTGAGINNLAEEWQLVWDPIRSADADSIVAFFSARRGVESFRWTPPASNQQVIVICPEWEINYRAPHLRSVRAKFVRVYDLEV